MSYKAHPDADKRIASAITTAKAIVRLDLYPAHKRELLSVCIWKVTEAAPLSKYQTRYRSRAAETASESELAHDHVRQRKWLIDEMLKDPDSVERILRGAVACVVTRSEHEALTRISREFPDVDGWERYERAGIEIVDHGASSGAAQPGAQPDAPIHGFYLACVSAACRLTYLLGVCFPKTATTAQGGGFNRWTQQLDEIVELVFRSPVSFGVVR